MASHYPIAMLSDRVDTVLVALKDQIKPFSYSVSRRRGELKDGREFVIFTQQEHIRGARISGFQIYGYPDPKLVQLAETRVMVGNRKTAAASPQ